MANYLLEIGTEEIPASFIANGLKDFKALIEKNLKEKNIRFEEVKTYGTPRRLTLIINGIEEKGEDLSEELRGPAKKAAFDAEGNPTKALLGFAKGQGVDVKEVTVKEVNGAEYVFAMKHTLGIETKPYLQSVLPELVGSINFPKTMRWGSLDYHFPRPIRWIVSLWNKEELPITIANITSGHVSRGHRFLSSGEVNITCACQYEKELEAAFVMVDPEKREQIIWEQIQKVAEENNAVVAKDEELLDEVVYLVEWPTALMGSFNPTYLEIPEEVVITPMREHQRYFPVRDKAGKLMNRFVTVRNGGDYRLDLVTEGNEKVLAARLADARFFWDEDRKYKLDHFLEKMDKVTFQVKLGSIGAKIRRIEKMTDYLCKALNVDAHTEEVAKRGAHLCKADLETQMVFEFTELQGIMGRYYALESGESKEVAEVIFEHYLPRFAGEETPKSLAGAIVSIADKIDTIVGIYCAGKEPSGSQDPFALRRQAMGICLTMLNQDLELDLDALIQAALDQYEYVVPEKADRDAIFNKVKDFFGARIRNILADNGNAYDVIEAAIGVDYSSVKEVLSKAEAITENRNNETFKTLQAVFTRANNLAKKGESNTIDPKLFNDDSEKSLYAALVDAEKALEGKVSKKEAVSVLSKLAEPTNNFFDHVMVMDKEEIVKNNRLGLLNHIITLTKQVGDLSKLQD